MAASHRPRQRRGAAQPMPPFALPSYWSPTQALAVFECIELLRDQLWLAYGPDIQHAERARLVSENPPPEIDPDSPF